MNKKAQGALEFLMTYGWAFLVILIMIGALAYFGVLSPSKFLPERCTLTTGLTCTDYKLTETTVDLKVTNNLGMTINITEFAVADASGVYTCTGTQTVTTGGVSADLSTDELGIPDGASFDLDLDTCSGGGIALGNKFKVVPTITYYDPRSGSDYDHNVEGELYALVQS